MDDTDKPKARGYLALIAWLALTFCAAVTSMFVNTGGWYAELAKPTWNPPGWVFGPVWTALYIMMAVAAWLVWQRGGWKAQRGPLTLYLVQWTLNALWTPLFFGLQRPGLAFVEILTLLVAIVATVVAFWRVRPAAAWLLLPYVAWATFATVLNFTIWRMNT
jgi:tryptophan-rich sensory protein